MKPVLIAVLLVVVAGAGFAVGRAMSETGGTGVAEGDGAAAAAREQALEEKVADLTRRLADEKARKARGGDTGRVRAAEAEDAAAAPAAGADAMTAPDASAAGATDPTAPFSLAGLTNAHEASERFMAFVQAQLGRGDAGFAAILEAVNTFWKDKQTLESLFSDESAAARELYPWLRMMVQREGQMLDLNEYVFRTMAEKPQQFESFVDDNALEIFTEGFAFVMPGAATDERMARMRGYAKKILETPEGDQPKAVRGNRGEIERLLARFWSEPVTPEQALEKLRAGDVAPRDLARYLRMVPPDAAAAIDVNALVLPHVRNGNYEMIRLLGVPPFDRLDVARLDSAAFEALEAGKMQGHFVGQYLQRTGRASWNDARAFVERGLAMGERTQNAMFQTLAFGLPPNLKPDKAYIEDLLQRMTVPEQFQRQLKANYGIK